MAVHHAELFMHIDQNQLVLMAAAFQAAFKDAAIGQIQGEHGREAEIALLLFDPEGDSAGWAEHLNCHALECLEGLHEWGTIYANISLSQSSRLRIHVNDII